VCREIDELVDRSLPAQDQFLQMRLSLQMHMAHLPQGSLWELVGEAVERVQAKIVGAAQQILQLREVGAAQMTLSLRMAGMGLRSTSAVAAQALILADVAVTAAAMQVRSADSRPISVASDDLLQLEWQAPRPTGCGAQRMPRRTQYAFSRCFPRPSARMTPCSQHATCRSTTTGALRCSWAHCSLPAP
jgi:hypothetical protein